MPDVWQVFLFAAGGIGGYVLATLVVTRALHESSPAAPDARAALSGAFHLIAVGAAIGIASLMGKIHGWTAWPLGGLAAILVYLLVTGIEFQIGSRLPTARDQNSQQP